VQRDVQPASSAPSVPAAEIPAAEVDESLLDWYRQLTMCERLRAASKSAATLERLARAATRDR
jgi:hypothetical protein